MTSPQKKALVVPTIVVALLSIAFSTQIYGYKLLINDTGKRVNKDIATEYAWISLKEVNFVNNKNDLKKYDKNQYVIIVKNKKYAPDEAHVFVFFPLKGDKKYDPIKQKEYALAILDFVKDGYMFPNSRGGSRGSIVEDVNMVVDNGLGPDIPIDPEEYDPDLHDPRIQIKKSNEQPLSNNKAPDEPSDKASR